MSRVKKVIQQFYWPITFFGFNWGQSYLATLVTPQNCTKMLRNLTFVVQFAFFSIRPKKVFVFLSNFRATFDCFWATFCMRNYGKLFYEQLVESSKYITRLFTEKKDWMGKFFFLIFLLPKFALCFVCCLFVCFTKYAFMHVNKTKVWTMEGGGGRGEGEVRRVSLSRA